MNVKEVKKLDLTLKKNHKILSEILTNIESDSNFAEGFLADYYNPSNNSIIVGITGTPGCGKSTILNLVVSHFLNKYKIAVLAVDPSSSLTKGALLGDRHRMLDALKEEKIFFRSLSTRGVLGGLSSSIYDMSSFLASAGFNLIFVETCGIGQSEQEIRELADIVVLVFGSDSGDYIQAMKAGPIEMSDMVLINKIDIHDSAIFRSFLKESYPSIKILEISALKEIGIDSFLNALQEKISSTKKVDKEKKIFFSLFRRSIDKENEKLLKNFSLSYDIKNPYKAMQTLRPVVIDHVAIAVKEAESAIKFFELLGFVNDGQETLEEQGVKVFFLKGGETRIEILEPLSKENSFSKTLEKRGEGIHHIAIKTKNFSKTLEKLEALNFKLIDKVPRKGAGGKKISFIHPKSTHGVLLELVEDL